MNVDEGEKSFSGKTNVCGHDVRNKEDGVSPFRLSKMSRPRFLGS